MNIQINENRSLACFVLFLFIVICFSNACQFARVVRYNFAGINDHKIFPTRILRPSLTPFYFEKANNPRFPTLIEQDIGDSTILSTLLKENDTVAFIISHKDTLHFEEYYGGHK